MEIIVSKRLSKVDIEKRMAFTSKSLNCFPALSGNEHMVDFDVRDECGHVWKFRIYTRKSNNKYRKPVLTKGWREFVCRKELSIDDKVEFYMDKQEADGSVEYRVTVRKAVKVFGAVFAHKPFSGEVSNDIV
ncbi:hypothetical protein Godav_020037 [Gossypium davidsonii]|uniref:TF-B3 domain-containing protein n=2 Tax=Gossypium davidsonii TaxID=34287 RepID=A0A7J8R2G4_GOSDV|nr:hypothetical protein [Gossypium davidsonii]